MKVLVTHFRKLKENGGLYSQRQIRLMGLTHRIEPRGGMTVVDILTDDETEIIATAHAKCSDLDNYNKKLGRLIATGRALKWAGLDA